MKKYILVSCLSIVLVSASVAQVRQRGEVVLINSKHTPLAGVELVAIDASPAVTDQGGCFVLELSSGEEGRLIQFQQIRKEGYEVVNIKDIETWVVSPERTYKIVMCAKGYLAESRMKFYHLGDDIYRKRYENTISELDKQVHANKISEEQYKQHLEEAGNEYQNSKEQLNYYADKFSRMNRDELKGVDSLAMSRFDSGDVDGAIKIYEDADILEKFIDNVESKNRISLNMNELTPALIKQIRLYILSKDDQLLKKATSMVERLLTVYPNNEELHELKVKIESYD